MTIRELLEGYVKTPNLATEVEHLFSNLIWPFFQKIKAGKRSTFSKKNINRYLQSVLVRQIKNNIGARLEKLHKLKKTPRSKKKGTARKLVLRKTSAWKQVWESLRNTPILLSINVRQRKGTPYVTTNPEGTKIFMTIPYAKLDIMKLDRTKLKNLLHEVLRHELNHVVDLIIGGMELKKYYTWEGDTEQTKISPYDYLRTPTEFNALIQEIKVQRSKNRREWNAIKTIKEFRDFVIDAIPSLYTIAKVEPKNYINKFEPKLIKALSKEKLLPSRFPTY